MERTYLNTIQVLCGTPPADTILSRKKRKETKWKEKKRKAPNAITCSKAYDTKSRFNTDLIAVSTFLRNIVVINQSGICWSSIS